MDIHLKSRTNIIHTFPAFAGLLLALLTFAATATASSNSDGSYFIDGYDVVSYFTHDAPKMGSTRYKTEYHGQTMLFINNENLTTFLANPEAHMPAYNGNCAYGMAFGMKSRADPLQYAIIDNRLYMQLDRGTNQRWLQRFNTYIQRSDMAWSRLTVSNNDF